MIKLPYGTERTREETIKMLVSIGALYIDENGLHASDPGVYPKRKGLSQ